MKTAYTHKIAVIICWYGPWPWYFKFFVHSVKFNPSIDFIIVTDTPVSLELPPNIQIVNKTLQGIRELASEKLGFQVAINSAYKLCDFKPAYGLFFEEYLKDYDFWGHGDCDVIFGNIRSFMTDEVLENFDVIAVRHDFLTGYFTLFRNENKVNNLFKQSRDYVKIFTNEKHFCFDETNFYFPAFTANVHYSRINSEIESMTHVVKKMHELKVINAYFDFIVVEGAEGKLKWSKGKLIYNRKFEVILYHLILFKTKCLAMNNIEDIPESFTIGKDQIYFR